VQTLLVWGGGVVLRSRGPRLAAACWLFEPALLVYSNLVMSDALFAVCALALGLAAHEALRPPRSTRAYAAAGAAGAACALTRPIGGPLAGAFVLVVAALVATRGVPARRLAVFAAVMAALISPRLYWNWKQHGSLALATQGQRWIEAVAGVVENHGTGLSFYESEEKWLREHPNRDRWEAYRAILERNPANTFLLSLKGAARVLFGHVNVVQARGKEAGTRRERLGRIALGARPGLHRRFLPLRVLANGARLAALAFQRLGRGLSRLSRRRATGVGRREVSRGRMAVRRIAMGLVSRAAQTLVFPDADV
jgi:4-amino-4-deoxy-L-arabinose transferase-like glycosyltransferase